MGEHVCSVFGTQRCRCLFEVAKAEFVFYSILFDVLVGRVRGRDKGTKLQIKRG